MTLDTTVGRESIKKTRRDGSEVNLTGPRYNDVAIA